jgi:hypothetical protein
MMQLHAKEWTMTGQKASRHTEVNDGAEVKFRVTSEIFTFYGTVT